MSTTPRHPLTIAAVLVLALGGLATALLLLLPMTAQEGYGDSACGSVLFNDDPNRFAGEAGCADSLETRRTQAFVVGALTVVGAGVLAFLPGSTGRREPTHA